MITNREDQEKAKAAKPFLRWAGSKRSAISSMKEFFPASFVRYVEPFSGSAAVFFHLLPSEALLSDFNENLINSYRQLRKSPRKFHDALSSMPRTKDHFYEIRSKGFELGSNFEKAVEFVYLNRNCFNGLYRTNKSGKFNVPFAESRRGENPTLDEILLCAQALKGVTLVNGDFEKVIRDNIKPNDFIYLDPPYLKRQGRIFNEYGETHFSISDMKRLSNLLKHIDQSGSNFLLSFIDDPIMEEIKIQWNCEKYMVQRNISGFSAHRRKSSELAIKNY